MPPSFRSLAAPLFSLALFTQILTLAACSDNASTLDPTVPPDQTATGSNITAEELREVTGQQTPAAGQSAAASVITVDAGPPQHADPNVIVSLQGSVTSTTAMPLIKTRWLQVQGPEVPLFNAGGLSTQIVTPLVTKPTQLVFKLFAVNSELVTHAATTTVTVQPFNNTPVQAASQVVSEQDNAMRFRIQLSAPSAVQQSLNYATYDQTATANADYTPIAGELVFAPGETEKTLTVQLLDDSNTEGNEYFQLQITGFIAFNSNNSADALVSIKAVGFIKDDEAQIQFPTTEPVYEGSASTQNGEANLRGDTGIVRAQLTWNSADTELNLRVIDPCQNPVTLNSESVTCDNAQSYAQGDSAWQNIYWPQSAAAGEYFFKVEHHSGLPTDYELNIWLGDQSRRFTGTIGNGDRLDVFRGEFSGKDGGESSSSGSSTSSSSASSSSSSSSSSSGGVVECNPPAEQQGLLAAVGTGSKDLTVLDTNSWEPQPHITRNMPEYIGYDVEFSHDKSRLAVGIPHGIIVICVATGDVVFQSPQGTPPALGLNWSPDDSSLAIVQQPTTPNSSDSLKILNTSDWSEIDGMPPISTNDVQAASISVSPTGEQLCLTTGQSPYLFLVNTADWSLIPDAAQISLSPRQCAWSPDGLTLTVSGLGDSFDSKPGIQIFNTPNWSNKEETIAPLDLGLASQSYDITFSPDGSMLAAVTSSWQWLRVFNTDTHELLHIFDTSMTTATAVAFSEDNSMIAVANSYGPRLRIYRTSDWSLIIEPETNLGRLPFSVDFN